MGPDRASLCVPAQVTLKSARGLMPAGLADRLGGCQARLVVPGHGTAVSGVVAPARDQEGVTWEHEEQFTEVGRGRSMHCCTARHLCMPQGTMGFVTLGLWRDRSREITA